MIKKIMAGLIGMTLAISLQATELTWNGSTDQKWSVDGNWSGGGSPGTGDSAVLNTGSNNVEKINYNGNWTIASGESLSGTATEGVIRGWDGTLTLATGGTINWGGTFQGSVFSAGNTFDIDVQAGATATVGAIDWSLTDSREGAIDMTFYDNGAGEVTTVTVGTLDLSNNTAGDGSLVLDLTTGGGSNGTYTLFSYTTRTGALEISVLGIAADQAYTVDYGDGTDDSVTVTVRDAVTATWTGADSGGSKGWSATGNWDTGVSPVNGDSVVLNTGSNNVGLVNLDGDWTIASGRSLTGTATEGRIRSTSDGTLTLATGGTMNWSGGFQGSVYSTPSTFDIEIQAGATATVGSLDWSLTDSREGALDVTFFDNAAGEVTTVTVGTLDLANNTAGDGSLVLDLTAGGGTEGTYTLFNYTTRTGTLGISVVGIGADQIYSVDYGDGSSDSVSIEVLPRPPIASPDRERLLPTNTYNVLFIPIDDMRPLINAYGETEPLRPITPNIDRLAASGVMFANAHCQWPVCNASRASLLTGLRPDTTKAWKLSTHFRTSLPNVITLPQHFGANGYRVHGMGKVFHGGGDYNQDVPTSWNEGYSSIWPGYAWYEAAKAAQEDANVDRVSATDAGVINTRDGDRPIVDADYEDGNAAEIAVAKIAEYASSYQTNGTPFFLAVGFKRPHLPFACPKTYWDLYDPAEIDLEGYTGNRQMPIGANRFTAPWGQEPSKYKDIIGIGDDDSTPTATEGRRMIHGYLACVTFVDAQIGKLLDALEDPDGDPNTDDSIADNTIIVLWSDHGYHLGDHDGFWAKNSNFENATRVPLIVRAPGMDALGAAGSRSVGLVELVDIYPTLLDLCSLPAPAQPFGQELQGTTFLPLLEDPGQPWKKAAFTQYFGTIDDDQPNDVPVANKGEGMGYSIRTQRYRYTEWWVTSSPDDTPDIIKAGITEPGHIELYDYVADPGETTNLAAHASYAGLVTELSALLNDSDGVRSGDGWKLPEVDAPTAYPVDSDVWKTNYLAPGRILSELDDNSDPDGDGIINTFEYKFGTHPLEADAPEVRSGFTNGSLYMTYPDVESRTNVLLQAETTTNLITGGWSGSGVTTTNSGQRGNATIKTSTVPADVPVRFLTLDATRL